MVKTRLIWSTYTVETTTAPVADTRRSSGKRYVTLGLGLVLLGVVLFVVQLQVKILRVPWYLPALGTMGVALLLVAALRKPTVLRIAVLALSALLASGEWYFLLSLSKLPVYVGPVAIGASFPAFTTILADGSPFDQQNLRGEQDTAMVFFRGRW